MSGPLRPEEYERRRRFLDNLKSLTKAEYIEIVRILNKHAIPYSENANGIFLNLVIIPQDAFDTLELFMNFTQNNRRSLADREIFLSTLVTTVGTDA